MSLNYAHLLEMTPESLAKEQRIALQNEMLRRVELLKNAIDSLDFSDIEIEHSPSGDCMGRDNSYIDWGWGDIAETMDKLLLLRKQEQST